MWIRCQKMPSPTPLKVREVFMAKPALRILRIPHLQQSVPLPNGKALSASRDDRSEYPALDLTPLRALSQERPSCKMALIRRAWPDILTALRAGHTLKCVRERLNEAGVAVEYKTLRAYVSVLHREQARGAAPVLEPSRVQFVFLSQSLRPHARFPQSPGQTRFPPPWNTSAKFVDFRTSPASRLTRINFFDVACQKTPSLMPL